MRRKVGFSYMPCTRNVFEVRKHYKEGKYSGLAARSCKGAEDEVLEINSRGCCAYNESGGEHNRLHRKSAC